MKITISLFDFSDPDKMPDPLHATATIRGNPDSLTFGPKKITIACGDDVACGTVSLPLVMLTELMGRLMAMDEERNASGLVGFDPPKLILPN